MSQHRGWSSRFLVIAGVVALLVVAKPRAAADVSSDAHDAIDAVLRKKVADLANQKDANGINSKRGTYSASFRKTGAATYAATFNVDTVEPSPEDPKTDRLRTDRYELTISGEGGNYKIVKEDLKDTSAMLYRAWVGGGEIYRFANLAFDKEGMKITASGGSAWMWTRQGKPAGMTVYADDLAYTYTPPPDTGYYELIKRRIVAEHPEDLAYKPERLDILCDPTSCADLMKTMFSGMTKLESGAGASAGSKSFAAAFDQEVRDFEKGKKDNPFGGPPNTPVGGFWLMPEPDRRFYAMRLRRSGKDNLAQPGGGATGSHDSYVTLSYDNWEPWEIRFYSTRYGGETDLGPYGIKLGTPLFAYYTEDVRKSSIPPDDLERRDDFDGRDYEVDSVKGDVGLALDENVAVDGDITYGLTIKREISYLPFSIARVNVAADTMSKPPRLFVNSIQDSDGNDLTWVRRGPFDGLVFFPKPIAANQKITLRMKFTNLDSIHRVSPSFAALDRGGWLPFIRFADFIDTFDLTVRTPEKYTVLGIGKKTSDEVANGVRTTRWTAGNPVSFPTIIFGDYMSGTAEHVVKKSDGTPITVTCYVDKQSTNALDTRILDTQSGTQDQADELRAASQTGARDIRAKALPIIATQAAVALDLYQTIYGVDYPYAKLDLVADPLGSFYGQAPSSIIYLGFGVFRGEGAMAAGSMFKGGANIAKFNKDVVAHETGHQWWGSVIANANQRNYWFIETMAEVSSALYVENVFGRKKYEEKVADWRDNILKNDQATSVQNNYTVWAGDGGFRSVQSNIYNKGPYAFHIFRSTFGDQKFFALLKAMAQDLKHEEIVTRDIQQEMEKVVGGNMDWFFDQWIRGIGRPQYALYWKKRQNEQGKWIVEGTIKQRVVFGQERIEMPGVYYRGVAPLSFVDLNGKETKSAKALLVQGAETPFRVIVPDEPEKVYFNKDGEILAEDLLVNTSW